MTRVAWSATRMSVARGLRLKGTFGRCKACASSLTPLLVVVFIAMQSYQFAAAANLPDVVKLPAGLDLGATSFYDGFGTIDPGFLLITYGQTTLSSSIKSGNGQPNAAFNNPQVNSFAGLLEPIYVSPLRLGDGAFGAVTIIPLVALQSRFGPGGVVLHDNGAGIGDIEPGVFYQHAPILRNGKPFFSYRVEFDFIAPTGKFDQSKDINIGSGYFSLNPYLAMTLTPFARWEFSTRLQYVYNFATSRFSDPPPVSGLQYNSAKAGQAAYLNFDASYSVVENFSLGVNGFYLRQLDEDHLNGMAVTGSRVTQLYVGPGAHYVIGPKNILNLNAYLPVDVRDTVAGPRFNLEYIHVF